MSEKLSKVLIIDDDPTTCFLQKDLMESLSVSRQIEIAYDGWEGLKLIEQYSQMPNEDNIPRLILVDLNMPFMDGFEFLEAYQKLEFKGKDSTVVSVVSSSFHPNDVKKVKEFPVVSDYIVKPLTKEKVVELVKNHFGWSIQND